MQRRLARWVAIACVSFSSLGGARTAYGQPSKEECATAYEHAQLSRRDGKLQTAKTALRTCASAECRITRPDCMEWLDEVQRSLPSVVFAARTPGGDALDVRVLVDGNQATTHLDGMAVEIDPGVHRIRFELEGRAPIEMTVVLVEGQKNRAVEAIWRDEPPAPPPPPASNGPAHAEPTAGATLDATVGAGMGVGAPQEAPREIARPVPTLAYVLGAVGVAGLGGFTAFALVGQSQKSSLGSSCAPFCTPDDLSASKTMFAVADASLAVAVLAFASAGVLYLTRPEVPRTTAQRAAWGVSVAPGTARVDWRVTF